MWGVPRLVESTKGSVLTLQLIQTWLPAAQLDLTVADFNNLAFHLGFVEVEWEASCDAMNEYHTCRTLELVLEFLMEYGTVPEGWPTEPEAWPGEDEWALRCDSAHSLCRDLVIKVGYENTNYIALPRTAHCEGHDF